VEPAVILNQPDDQGTSRSPAARPLSVGVALGLLSESLVTFIGLWPAAMQLPSRLVVLRFGGLGAHGLGGTAGVVIVVALMGVRIYTRSRRGGRGRRRRGPFR
jgi:hypothetical protein